MKKLILLAVMAVAMVSCTDKKPAEVIGCAVQGIVKTSVASVVAQELSCKNVAEIEKTIEAELAKTKICTSEEATVQDVAAKSAFGDLVCTPVIASITTLITAQIPTAWECDPSVKVTDLKEKLIAKCKEKL